MQNSENARGYFDAITEYGSYSKDLLKDLNLPFAYNLARYKNLSIEGLFDMNRPSDNEDKPLVEADSTPDYQFQGTVAYDKVEMIIKEGLRPKDSNGKIRLTEKHLAEKEKKNGKKPKVFEIDMKKLQSYRIRVFHEHSDKTGG